MFSVVRQKAFFYFQNEKNSCSIKSCDNLPMIKYGLSIPWQNCSWAALMGIENWMANIKADVVNKLLQNGRCDKRVWTRWWEKSIRSLIIRMRWDAMERDVFSSEKLNRIGLVFTGVAAIHKSAFCFELVTHILYGKSIQAERASSILSNRFRCANLAANFSILTSRRTRINCSCCNTPHINADNRWIVALMSELNERIVIVTIFILACFGEHFNEIDWLFLLCFKVIRWVGSFFSPVFLCWCAKLPCLRKF